MPALTPVLRFSIALLALANAATLHQIALSQSAENSANRLSSLPSTKTLVLTEEFHSEGAAIGDLDGDGNQDIISGPFYYRGPDFSERISYTPVKKYHIKQYSDHFFSFVFDFNSDGMLDILSIPIPGGKAIWFQNPGNRDQLWDSHLALNGVGNESPAFADLTGDGQPELVCIHQGEIGFASWNREEPSKPWTFRSATQGQRLGEFTHGLGVGDVNADGRLDLLETRGWWEQASEGTSFQFHPQQFSNSGGSQMFAYDLDGDGDQDVISVQNAHSYGLSWFERRGTGTDYLFVEHKILTGNPSENEAGVAISQMHSLALADLDGDGVQDILTGKRFFAHGGKDPGAFEPAFLLALRTVREQGRVRFEPHILSERSGVGTQLTVGDVDNNGTQDIVVGNKLGTFVTLNSGNLGPALPQSSEPYTRIGTRDFSVHVRETPARSPAEEAGLFRLPSGFEIKLVASEPDIAKPMNMAFDSLGRLWVSSSLEYPFAAPVNQLGRDTIKILEDTTGDGRADKITTFADGLNIPIGLYPYRDGVICFSIPNVLFLRDTNGDGHADQREILFGPMDTTRDTHGMCNGFTRGHDGWLYACHGFNNQSNITSRDGNQVVMHSGNTFRMRVDGSRLEHFTHGQVNPFGLSLDRWGDLFSA
ncbi:MAG: PVC-type heme-binding CxxCH protein, partial [Planctomycetota bacterium]